MGKKKVSKKTSSKNRARTPRVLGVEKPCFWTKTELDAAKKKDWNQILESRDRAEEVLSRCREMILSHPNVTGLHLGFKRVTNRTEQGTKELFAKPLTFAICVHVRGKMDPADPSCQWAIPAYFEGIPTDIMESEFEQSIATTPFASTSQPVGKLEGGVAIGRQTGQGSYGTLGFVVSSLGDDVLLTNAHVAGPAGTIIVQPPNGSGNEVGETTFSKTTSTVDGAIIFPTSITLPTERTILSLNIPSSAFRDAELTTEDLAEEVFLVGATTGMKVGIVESISAEVNILDRFFQNQIEITSEDDITAEGNSGAAVIQKEVIEGTEFFNIVGLVHAQSGPKKVIASHFRDVKRVLGIKLR